MDIVLVLEHFRLLLVPPKVLFVRAAPVLWARIPAGSTRPSLALILLTGVPLAPPRGLRGSSGCPRGFLLGGLGSLPLAFSCYPFWGTVVVWGSEDINRAIENSGPLNQSQAGTFQIRAPNMLLITYRDKLIMTGALLQN